LRGESESPPPKPNLENYQDIVPAVGDYNEKPTDPQTEDVVDAWYGEYDSMLATIFRENLDLQSVRESNTYYSNETRQQGANYQKCMKAKGRRSRVEPARTAR
jgi:hypothetical protein